MKPARQKPAASPKAKAPRAQAVPGKPRAALAAAAAPPVARSGGKKPARFYEPNAVSLSSERNINYLVKCAFTSLIRMSDQGVAPLGLTAMQWRPLVILRYGNMDTPAELARSVNVDTGAMTRTLDRLEAKGFLTRRRSQEDRRVVKLELTPSGHDVVEQILPAISNALNAHLSGFTTEEFELFLQFLRRLIANGPGGGPSCLNNER